MMKTTQVSVNLDPRRTALILFASVGALLTGSLLTQVAYRVYGHDHVMGLVPLLYVDREANLPTWFSSTMLLASAVILWSIGRDGRQSVVQQKGHWYVMAGIFLALAIDEAASIHELFTSPMRELLGASGMLYYTWIIPGAAFVVVFFLSYIRFLLRLPAAIRFGLIAAGGLFVTGALGVEMAGAYYESVYGTKSTMTYSLITHLEEGLEMVGIACFISVLLVFRRSYLDIGLSQIEDNQLAGEFRNPANTRPAEMSR